MNSSMQNCSRWLMSQAGAWHWFAAPHTLCDPLVLLCRSSSRHGGDEDDGPVSVTGSYSEQVTQLEVCLHTATPAFKSLASVMLSVPQH
jgi:hypothetical protein